MRLQKLLTLALWLCCVQGIYAQDWTKQIQKPNANFNEIKKSFDTYWKDRPYKRGQGYKQYKRWEYFWEKRVLPNGDFPRAGIKQTEWTKYKQAHPELNNQNKKRTTANTTGSWTAMGPSSSPGGYNGVGRITSVGFDPTNANTFYVGTPAGGLWKTTDGGSKWSNLTDDLPIIGVSSIVVHPTNVNTIYIATGDADGGDTPSLGVMKSTNGGANWVTTGLNWGMSQGEQISVLLIHPATPDILIAATSSGIYKTTNGGTSWTSVKSGTFRDLEFKPGASPATVYATGKQSGDSDHQIFVSNDTGDTWTKKTSFSGVNRVAIAVSVANDAFVAAVASGDDNGFAGFYTSANSGVSFAETFAKSKGVNLMGWEKDGSDSGGQGWYDLAIAVSPANANEIHVGGVNNWKSTNGGTSWTISSHWSGSGGITVVHADKHYMTYHPLQTGTLFECNDGGIYKTTDGGTNWTDLTNGIAHTQFYKIGVSQTDADYVVAGAQDNGTKLKSGSSWGNIGGGDGMECIIDPTDKNTQYYSVYYGVVYREKSGVATKNITASLLPKKGAWVTPYVLDPSDNKTILIGYQDVFRSANQGDNWTNISNGQVGTSNLNAIAVAPTSSNTIYAASYSKIYRTTDASNWTNITSGLSTSGRITYIMVSSTDPNTVWVTFSGYSGGKKVYKSTDGGSNWTNISGSLPNLRLTALFMMAPAATKACMWAPTWVFFTETAL